MKDCKTCKVISILLGKKIITSLFKHNYKKISLKKIKKHLVNLNLEVVGGLKKTG